MEVGRGQVREEETIVLMPGEGCWRRMSPLRRMFRKGKSFPFFFYPKHVIAVRNRNRNPILTLEGEGISRIYDTFQVGGSGGSA